MQAGDHFIQHGVCVELVEVNDFYVTYHCIGLDAGRGVTYSGPNRICPRVIFQRQIDEGVMTPKVCS